jgi:hypothetical protein
MQKAPAPIFSRLQGLHNWVLCRSKVFGGMLVFGAVTATDMAARETDAQVHPFVTGLLTFQAAGFSQGRWMGPFELDLTPVLAKNRHG